MCLTEQRDNSRLKTGFWSWLMLCEVKSSETGRWMRGRWTDRRIISHSAPPGPKESTLWWRHNAGEILTLIERIIPRFCLCFYAAGSGARGAASMIRYASRYHQLGVERHQNANWVCHIRRYNLLKPHHLDAKLWFNEFYQVGHLQI